MANAFAERRKRQITRLGGAKPPTPRAVMALAKVQLASTPSTRQRH